MLGALALIREVTPGRFIPLLPRPGHVEAAEMIMDHPERRR